MNANELSIYIHVPYCKKACSYCDFYFSTSMNSMDDFISALINEIDLVSIRKNPQNNFIVKTLYFGGGTPGLLSFQQIENILNAIKSNYSLESDAEITLEVNPDNITPENLQNWLTLGFNRLSIGIQSFLDRELEWMNRTHSSEKALQAVPDAQAAGFQNINIDLIYATPFLNDLEWRETLNKAFELNPPHISAYALTVEPKTKLAYDIFKKRIIPPDENSFQSHFTILQEMITENGFIPYEISNFCLPGFQSKHNSNYWKRKPYIGFGPSAHSFDGKRRFANESNIHTYIRRLEENRIEYPFEETLTNVNHMNEYIMTQLRCLEGINLNEFRNIFKCDLFNLKENLINEMLNEEFVFMIDESIRLSLKGKFFADFLAAELMFEEEES